MESTFRGTKLFTGSILKNWNTLSVTDFSHTFYDAISFEGNVEKFNIDNVVRSDDMFGMRNSLNNCTKRGILEMFSKKSVTYEDIDIPLYWSSLPLCGKNVTQSLSFFYDDCYDESSCTCTGTIELSCT